MTNGEKFKETFSISQVDEGELYAYMWLPSHDAVYIPRDWWNAEYKEPTTNNDVPENNVGKIAPTTKNDLGADCISRAEAIDTIRQLYLDLATQKAVIDLLKILPSVTPQLSSELEKNSKLEKIRDQLKSNLRGVEIALEVLVENDPLRPKMEGAKTTLEDCLELIDKVEGEG